MCSNTPHTPSRKDESDCPFAFSLSPSQYLNYASEPCSSPTPLPTNNPHVPVSISPYEYQLAHLGHKPTTPDASFALKSDYRSFGTLTAAETLLSVQSGSGPFRTIPTPPSSHSSSLGYRHRGIEMDSPRRSIWPSSLSSTLLSPSKPRTGDPTFLASAFPSTSISGHLGRPSLSFSSSFEQDSSSSQLTSMGWQEPQTPRTSERQIGYRKTVKGLILSPSPGLLNPFSPRKYSPKRAAARPSYGLNATGSFSSPFEHDFHLASPDFDLRYPNELHLSTPHGPRSMQIEDDSPVLRQTQQGKEDSSRAPSARCARDTGADSDEESELYASQSGSATLVNRSSPICSDDGESLASSDCELPSINKLFRSASSALESSDTERPACTSPQSSDSDLHRHESSSSPSCSTAAPRKTYSPSYTFKDRHILNNPVTALTGPRASKSKAERLISTIAAAWTPSPRRKTRSSFSSLASSPVASRAAGLDPAFESPLSSVPSTPGSHSSDSPCRAGIGRKSTRVEGVFTIGSSPIGGRATRAQTRALAAVLRPYADTNVKQPRRTLKAQSGDGSRKRERGEAESTERPGKRAKAEPSSRAKPDASASAVGNSDTKEPEESSGGYDVGRRTFPTSIPIHSSFPAFYRRFTVPKDRFSSSVLPGAVKNYPRSAMDLYTPRWVKGRGTTKVGLCPLCAEPPARGGEGRKVWLSMKFSAFKCYHMQYYHGISPSTGLPFSPPVAFMHSAHLPHSKSGFKLKQERSQIEQGKCHKCNKWVPVEGVKDVEVKVKEIFWWKHAASCHQRSTIPGEKDVFVDDAEYRAAQAAAEDEDDDTTHDT